MASVAWASVGRPGEARGPRGAYPESRRSPLRSTTEPPAGIHAEAPALPGANPPLRSRSFASSFLRWRSALAGECP